MSQTLRQIYTELRHNEHNIESHSIASTPPEIRDSLLAKCSDQTSGKVRDIFFSSEDIYLYHTDRLTAFDRAICNVPYRGVILAALTDFWMTKASAIIPTQRYEKITPRLLKAERATPVKVEVVIRGYLAGSMMRAYNKGIREFCGHQLPEQLSDYQKLPQPLITPTSKAEVFEHDEDLTEKDILSLGLCSNSEWEQIKKYSLAFFALGQEIYAKAGWILVDTKYEFGRRTNGEIILIDECHTPDSSRLWRKDTHQNSPIPEMFDKEIIRRYLLEQGFSGHGEVPPVPGSIILDLAEGYLTVTESLLGSLTVDTYQ